MSLLNNNAKMRYVGPEHSKQLAALHAQCFPHYWDSDAFSNFFIVHGTQALVIENSNDAGELIGMLVYRMQFEQADIITLAVKETHRRQGLARSLLDKAIADMREKGVTELFLDVEDGNDAAITLYNHMGFSCQRRRRLYYRQKDGSCTDALVMTKKFS